MAYGKETRLELRKAFIFEQLSLEAAALKLGLPARTAVRWKAEALAAGDDWDKLKSASLLAGDSLEDLARQMLTDYIVQHKSLMESLKTDDKLTAGQKVGLLASLADSFNKTIAASRKVLPETSALAVALDVLNALADFVKGRYPQHINAFVEILEPFGEEVAKKYG